MRLDGVGAVRAGLWALGGFTLSTCLVFAFVLTTVPPCAPTGAMRSMRQAAGTS